MKQKILLTLCTVLYLDVFAQTYNNLWIPDTLSGKTFNLEMKEGTMNWIGTTQTNTSGFNVNTNHGAFWGPTLFFNDGDTVRMHVVNSLMDTTTVHWHGMHLPAVMDGGPHQPIPPNAIWDPFWKVMNHAATYWYHPHLHMMSAHQITQGLGGFIIVRDAIEKALVLPRTYGIDDIPLALSDRRFTSGQLEVAPYGDSMMVNGVMRAQWSAPAQVIRFRILNAGTERSYNLGFSDNRNFYVIASDGGLLNAPVTLNRYLLSAGERIEILVNFSGQSGQSVDLKAYNSVLTQNIPGGDVFPNGPFKNALARVDFNILHFNITSATSNAVTTMPSSLTTVVPYLASSANTTRNVSISDTTITGIPGISFLLNHRLYDEHYNDYEVPLNNTEIWEIKNTGNFSHPFHIHDVEFNILTRDGVAPPLAEQGWKDVVLVKSNETVRFITRFENFSDKNHPYMFHCHIALHEDDGMMGQFVVVPPSGIKEYRIPENKFSIYPVPSSSTINFNAPSEGSYTIYNSDGKQVLSGFIISGGKINMNISGLPNGLYLFYFNGINTQKFIVQHY